MKISDEVKVALGCPDMNALRLCTSCGGSTGDPGSEINILEMGRAAPTQEGVLGTSTSSPR